MFSSQGTPQIATLIRRAEATVFILSNNGRDRSETKGKKKNSLPAKLCIFFFFSPSSFFYLKTQRTVDKLDIYYVYFFNDEETGSDSLVHPSSYSLEVALMS